MFLPELNVDGTVVVVTSAFRLGDGSKIEEFGDILIVVDAKVV